MPGTLIACGSGRKPKPELHGRSALRYEQMATVSCTNAVHHGTDDNHTDGVTRSNDGHAAFAF